MFRTVLTVIIMAERMRFNAWFQGFSSHSRRLFASRSLSWSSNNVPRHTERDRQTGNLLRSTLQRLPLRFISLQLHRVSHRLKSDNNIRRMEEQRKPKSGLQGLSVTYSSAELYLASLQRFIPGLISQRGSRAPNNGNYLWRRLICADGNGWRSKLKCNPWRRC